VIAPPAVSVVPFASTIELVIVTSPVGGFVAEPTVIVPVVPPAFLDVEVMSTVVPLRTDDATAPCAESVTDTAPAPPLL